MEIQEKNYFGRIFHKFSRKPRLSSTKTTEIPPYFLQFLFCVRIALKKFTQVLSYVVYTQVRRHVQKRITNSRYGEEKPRHFVLRKQFCSLSVWDLLRLTPWVFLSEIFYHMFVTVSIVFWVIFEPQILPTRLETNFLLITVRAERKVHLCVKLFDFYHGWIIIRLTWNFSRFVPNSVDILTWKFRKKLFQENFLEIFAQTKAILYQNLWSFGLLSAVFILRPYCAK